VEFVWLPASTSPGPAQPQKIQILPKRPTLSLSSPRLPRNIDVRPFPAALAPVSQRSQADAGPMRLQPSL
jgi:hypothetical protein